MSAAANKELVIAFYQQAFNDGQPEQAAAAHLGATYTQHNPGPPTAPRASSATCTGCAASSPNCTWTSSAPSPRTTWWSPTATCT